MGAGVKRRTKADLLAMLARAEQALQAPSGEFTGTDPVRVTVLVTLPRGVSA